MWETRVRCLGWEDPLEKGMATHSSILAWRIPWTVHGITESAMTECLSLPLPFPSHLPTTQPLPIALHLSFIPRPDCHFENANTTPLSSFHPSRVANSKPYRQIQFLGKKKKREREHKRPFRMQLKPPVQPHPLLLLSRLYFHCI